MTPPDRNSLSATEARLVEVLRSAAGTTVGRDALAAAVWGDGGEARRVDFAVRRLRAKLEASSVVLTVHGEGYRWRDEPAVPAPPPATVLDLADRTVDLGSGEIRGAGPPEWLTAQELAVLRVLVDANGVPVGRDRLLADVWGWRSSRTSRRPDGVVHQLRRKLEPDPHRPRLVTGARGTGWRLVRPPVRTNAPPALGRFVGRDALLAELIDALSHDRWLVLTGPPGVGKTRLARELCLASAEGYDGGAWFVDLASVTRAADVHQRLASTFGLIPGSDPRTTVTAFLASGPARLVVLDNVEQIPSLMELVPALLAPRSGGSRRPDSRSGCPASG